jgi:iron complex outermembrane receptor protein
MESRMSLRSGLKCGAAFLITLGLLTPGVSLAQTAKTASATGSSGVEEVTVAGIRHSIEDAIENKRQSAVIMDNISAEDIGKLPDQNVAETLSRIPGVQISRVEGQGGAVSVRGINLNKLQLNGNNFVGTAANGDANLTDFAPELLAGVEVIKAPSADLTEGWLGGIINLRTKRPLDFTDPVYSARAEMSYADKARKGGFKLFGFGTQNFFNDQLGVLLGATYSQSSGRSDQFTTGGWTRSVNATDVNGDGVKDTFIMPLRLQQFVDNFTDKRLGLNGTAQWRPMDTLTVTLDGLYSQRDVYRPLTAAQAVLSPANVTNGIILTDGTLAKATFGGVTFRPLIYNEGQASNSDALALNVAYVDGPWSAHFNASQSQGNALGQDGLSGTSTAPGNANVLVARQLNPANTVSANYQLGRNNASPDYNFTSNYNMFDPAQYEVFATFDANYPIKNRGRDYAFDVRYETNWGPLKAIKIGARLENTRVLSAQANATYPALNLYDPTPATSLRVPEVSGINSGPVIQDFMDGQSGNFPRALLSGTPQPDVWRAFLHATAPDLSSVASLGSINQVNQQALAGFIKFEFGGDLFGIPYTGDAGLRDVDVHRGSSGYSIIGGTQAVPTSVSRHFNDPLPNANLILKPTDDFDIRLSMAKVTARPPLNTTGVGVSLAPVTNTGSAGNPDLKPYAATQYDLSAEWYFTRTTMVSVALFKKDVSAFTRIIQIAENHPEAPNNTNGQTLYLVNRPVNGADGEVGGFEFNLQQDLDFLPFPFDGLGIGFNYTRADSRTPNIDELTGAYLPLPFSSKHSANATLFYEKGPVSWRATWNYRSPYLLAQQGAASGGSLFADSHGQVDLSAGYQITDDYRITFEAVNIGKDMNSYYVSNKNRINNAWQDDTRLYLGLAANF